MSNIADRYVYRVEWSEEDGEFVGLCAELPSLSWLAESPDEAFAGIRGLAVEVLQDMEANGEEPPEPLSVRRYSGKIHFRTTPEVHKKLAICAAEARVSLNRFLNSKITSNL